jgi:hypothetical protein
MPREHPRRTIHRTGAFRMGAGDRPRLSRPAIGTARRPVTSMTLPEGRGPVLLTIGCQRPSAAHEDSHASVPSGRKPWTSLTRVSPEIGFVR